MRILTEEVLFFTKMKKNQVMFIFLKIEENK